MYKLLVVFIRLLCNYLYLVTDMNIRIFENLTLEISLHVCSG